MDEATNTDTLLEMAVKRVKGALLEPNSAETNLSIALELILAHTGDFTRPAPKADSALVGQITQIVERAILRHGPADALEGTRDDAREILAALSDRDVVLEEAAKKIDQRASYHGDQDQGPRRQAAWKEARECAAVIRALKGGVDE